MADFTSNKQIAKNTLFLYVRMFLTIVVNLYAVRVIWQVLGVDDYGIYNVVGGIVMMFAFINSGMVASSQRFISFELGTGNKERLRKVFCISINVHFLLAIIILILTETIGLWFLNVKLNIAADRMYAANWVYQCSIVAFMINVISVPYNACIVAHEHMKAYGYFGILEVLLKLSIVFLLLFIPGDKLITYSILVMAVALVMRTIYGFYCSRNFEECHWHFVKDRNLVKDMFSFAGWSFIGNMGFSVRDQGINIILNLFFNVAVNAAKGVANSVGSVISGFAGSFQMALSPQITKRYAAGEIDSMMKLVFQGCKYSVLLMMLCVIPLTMASGKVLQLWLGDVAPFTVGFTQLMLIMVLVESIVSPITTSLQATGSIRNFQIIISIIMIMNLPMAWLWLYLDSNPYGVMMVCIATAVVGVIARLILLHRAIPFSYREFISKVILRIIYALLPAGVTSYYLYSIIPESLVGFIIYCLISVSVTAILIYLLGLDIAEKALVKRMVTTRIRNIMR